MKIQSIHLFFLLVLSIPQGLWAEVYDSNEKVMYLNEKEIENMIDQGGMVLVQENDNQITIMELDPNTKGMVKDELPKPPGFPIDNGGIKIPKKKIDLKKLWKGTKRFMSCFRWAHSGYLWKCMVHVIKGGPGIYP